MLLSNTINLTCRYANKNYLETKGYIWEFNKTITINTYDLSEGSKIIVRVKCDYCGKIHEKAYSLYIRGRDIIQKDCCKNIDCIRNKRKEVLLKIYNVENSNVVYSMKSKDISKYKYLFEEKMVKPLFDTYKNEKELLPFLCLKHNKVVYKSISRLKKIEVICDVCMKEKRNSLFKSDFELVKQIFLDNNLVVYDDAEYINSSTPIKCFCIKHPEQIQYINIQQAKRKYHGCELCKESMKEGENNPNWKGGIKPINDQIRSSDKYKQWVQDVFIKDSYTCQCCGDNVGGNLQAHHIKNFSTYEDLRFDINNGITLCDLCHNPNKYGSFHNLYGTHDNTPEQLEEYILRYKNGELNELRKRNN